MNRGASETTRTVPFDYRCVAGFCGRGMYGKSPYVVARLPGIVIGLCPDCYAGLREWRQSARIDNTLR